LLTTGGGFDRTSARLLKIHGLASENDWPCHGICSQAKPGEPFEKPLRVELFRVVSSENKFRLSVGVADGDQPQ
jgi:hypothetical protein